MINYLLSFGYSAIGTLLYSFGDYQSAIDNYNLAIQENSEDASSYVNRGMARRLTDDYSGAIEDLSQAIQIEPLNIKAYAERAYIRAIIGENQAAIEDSNRVLEISPQYLRAYYTRAVARSHSGDYQGALEDFTHLNTLQSDCGNYYNLGTLQYLHGSKAQAIKNLTKAIDSSDSSIPQVINCVIYIFGLSPAYYIRGNIFYDIGDEQAANEDFQEAMKIEATMESLISEDDEHGFWGRGLARHRLGNQEGAIKDLQTAAKIALKHQNIIFHQKIMELMQEINPQQQADS
jgi:tetratricopeptide (TPR) repeat protein